MPTESDLTWAASIDDAQSEKVILAATVPPLGAIESSPAPDDLGRFDCDC